ncbi:hypothetical protein DYB32_009347 [Aphanomyces invadans]|uniref:Apple domain-containing protein n=1 Tax=Aphanomyces invadans TaxID=157072 RepID=A0A3R6ZIP0_9STRA|nr:hypothetical protein DYB32_009347 [Aphanomyces invadans]
MARRWIGVGAAFAFAMAVAPTIVMGATVEDTKLQVKRPFIGKIGELVNITLSIPVGKRVHHRIVATKSQTQFMGLRFSTFDLAPGDSLQVFSDSNSFTYSGHGPSSHFSDNVHGNALEFLYTPGHSHASTSHEGITITAVLEGFPSSTGREDVCGVQPQWWPNVCNATKLPDAYKNSKSIARLTMDGIKYGTGFLVGCDGYFLTNNHNVNTKASASTLKFEFGAESATCRDPCNSVALGCPGSVVVTGANLLATDETLDYSLLQLSPRNRARVAQFGYLSLRKTAPTLHEPIYVIHHPDGFPKAFTDRLENGTETVVTSVSVHNECGKDQVGYMADTRGGSSGSPVFGRVDHKVIALHHCGGCENVAHAMSKIVADLKKKLKGNVPRCFFHSHEAKSTCSLPEEHVEFVGYDCGSVLAANPALCCGLCSKHKRCKAFTWTKLDRHADGGTCWFKSMVGTPVHTLGGVSGIVLGE